MLPNLDFIHARWASLYARGSSDSLSADYSRDSFIILIAPNPMGQPARLEKLS